jgi:hypothetical protein
MFKQSAAQKQRLEKWREAIRVYLSSEDLESKHIATILQLVDLYGLLHSALPRRRATARDIHRQAEAAALSQQKKVWRALRGTDAHEQHAKSEAAAEVARKKVKSQLYQRVRGSAVISRLATPADRQREFQGRRTDLEVTRFLQVGMRFLTENCDQAPDHAEECLAGITLRAEGKLQPSKRQVQKMKNRVHTRLMDGPAVDDFDYHFAIGEEPGEEWLFVSMPMP